MDPIVVNDFKERISGVLSKYEPKDVFNCDETGLFYRALPDRTLAQKGDKVKGGKQSKERLTVLFACSFTGEKLKPLERQINSEHLWVLISASCQCTGDSTRRPG